MVPSDTNLQMDNTSNEKSVSLHPLKYRWNLWGHLPQDSNWTLESYRKFCTFKTIEDCIAVSESLSDGIIKYSMLFIMKEGIAPLWEDPQNRNGGCFSYKVLNKHVCQVWKDLTYALVGNSISNNNDFLRAITGITISPKKNFCIIKIWITNCEYQNPQVVNEIKNLTLHGCLFKQHNPEY
jgi:hypothetical protein